MTNATIQVFLRELVPRVLSLALMVAAIAIGVAASTGLVLGLRALGVEVAYASVAVAAAFTLLLAAILRHGRGPRSVLLRLGDDALRREWTDGSSQQLPWSDLTKVEILTTSDGPWREDFYFFLHGSRESRPFVIAQGEVPDEFVSKLASLPGFSYSELARAAGCTSYAVFLCWQQSQHTG